MLVGLRARIPSKSCFGRDIELLTSRAQKYLPHPNRGMTRLPPGSASYIIQIRDLSSTKYLDHQVSGVRWSLSEVYSNLSYVLYVLESWNSAQLRKCQSLSGSFFSFRRVTTLWHPLSLERRYDLCSNCLLIIPGRRYRLPGGVILSRLRSEDIRPANKQLIEAFICSKHPSSTLCEWPEPEAPLQSSSRSLGPYCPTLNE